MARLKPGSSKPFDKRKPSAYVHVEKPDEPEVEDAEEGEEAEELPVEEDDDEGIDVADGIVPAKLDD